MTQPVEPAVTAPMEHERRFRLRELGRLPVPFYACKFAYITQGYIGDGQGLRVRDQYSGLEHLYTKTMKTGSGVSRVEEEEVISERLFRGMWKDVRFSLEKSRYFIPLGKVWFELNIFHGPLAGYMQVKIEFNSAEEADAFIPPIWFGEEVTTDKRHGNYALAKDGKPSND